MSENLLEDQGRPEDGTRGQPTGSSRPMGAQLISISRSCDAACPDLTLSVARGIFAEKNGDSRNYIAAAGAVYLRSAQGMAEFGIKRDTSVVEQDGYSTVSCDDLLRVRGQHSNAQGPPKVVISFVPWSTTHHVIFDQS
ncbi:hypothetical protein CIHG_00645 [Coccidioides immitis H538.4]|uniref:Uncharacterized protein n=3 Tax=Coccidioides immitis TaxID=5501 RepID=A0A0J8QHE0_COCIT|nr:hypothetical protein CIRG_07454 [Coccidioides immitis RMSCC 2394]KMU71769.1 hypothetical protein CISG_00080 [Coccidioides immitis RMSCC 3703]KMU82863.1 hypothetical protein CIHG_00645 [Coccidioides immitis H538.4]